MPISNPAQWFVTGSKRKYFTHKGGSTLYNFSPYDSGLSTSLEMNIIFFADSVDHAKKVIERILKLKIKCAEEFIEYHTGQDYGTSIPSRERVIEKTQKLLEGKDNWVINEAPTNQVFKIGWATNDTI